MKIKSTIVVAAATGAAFAPNAEAAPQQTSAAPVWSWTGFYVGGHLGGASQRAWTEGRTQGSYVGDTGWSSFLNKTKHSGFIGGATTGNPVPSCTDWRLTFPISPVQKRLHKLRGPLTVR